MAARRHVKAIHESGARALEQEDFGFRAPRAQQQHVHHHGKAGRGRNGCSWSLANPFNPAIVQR
jgi:hypothetical protein